MRIDTKRLVLIVLLTVTVHSAKTQQSLEPGELLRGKGMILQICVALRSEADRMEQKGRQAGSLRDSLAIKAGLDEADRHALRRIVDQLAHELNPLDLRARAIIKTARDQYPGGRLPRGVSPPSLPPELTELQRQRDGLIGLAAAELDQQLGPQGVAKLDSYLSDAVRTGKLQALPLRTPNDIGRPVLRSLRPAAGREGARP